MYEQHFGFKRRPFRAVATGADVFVGPQTARIMQATKLALATPDAVIAVMGPPGTGKTTIVNRALDAIDGDKLVIRIARMQLGHDEVLDFLLDELQAQNVPASTIRKVTLFRRLLAERTSAGVRVVIVLEDAIRIGDDALAEIEALTAADGVGNEGAALVIMGEPELRDRLDGSALTRLKQRIRAYQFVNPLVAPELQGYLKHCFRLGGGEFDLAFDAQGAQFLHALTGGVPRTANNVVEAILNAAAARKLPRIDNRFVAAVAENEFGLTATMPEPVMPAPRQAARAAATPQPDAAAKPAATVIPTPAPAASASPAAATAKPGNSAPAAETPAAAPAVASPDAETGDNADATKADADDDIPELIHDTLPDLEVLAPELTADSDDESSSAASMPELDEPEVAADEPEVAADEPADDDLIPMLASTGEEPALDAANSEPSVEPGALPELQPETTAIEDAEAADDAVPELTPEPESEEIPELTLAADAEAQQEAASAGPEEIRDPTMAELKPDFDVLEEAMAGLANDDEAAPEAEQAVPEEEAVRDPTLPSLPTITLDAAIQDNIAEATAALRKHDATIAHDIATEESSGIAAARPQKSAADAMSDTDIKKIASGIRKARSLEDVDEKMAETLFGAEFSAIAARVIANPPSPSETSSQPQLDVAADSGAAAVPDEDQLMQELSLVEDSIASNPKDKATAGNDAPELDKPTTEMEKEFLDVYGKDALEVSLESEKPNPGMDLSASQRLATVRALNAEQAPKAAMPPKPAAKTESNAASPQPIEEQISTSMTATLKALSVRPDSANDEDDDEEETPKRGFFSRFRRS